MRALLVDDHALVAEAIGATLSKLDGTAEARYASTLKAALAQLRSEPEIDLVLLDLGLPDAAGLDGLTGIRAEHPTIPVVVISANEERETVVAALEAGAMGFIPKSSSSALLSAALTVVFAGGVYIPPLAISKSAPTPVPIPVDNSHVRVQTSRDDLRLSEQDWEMLRYLVYGFSNKEIGKRLDISPHTARRHVTNVLRVLRARNRADAVMECARLGIQFEPVAKARK